eukprot:m.246644 g.246644  ORF g.246644 m.246644 type:complete len:557 (-) comp15122_c0_seq1:54-1724(-)
MAAFKYAARWATKRFASTVPGLMQDHPLNLNQFVWRAERLFRHKEIVSNTFNGKVKINYGDWATRVHKLGDIFNQLNIGIGSRVGTYAWNNANHMELFFGIPCSGRVCHTLNIRLFPEQITYIVNHAEDEIIFVDRSLLPAILPIMDKFKTVKHIVVMDDGKPVEIPKDPRFLDYEQLMAGSKPVPLLDVDERSAAGMCYTSGTTGNPKGVVYTHRSQYLHCVNTLAADLAAICERDVILPVVPMFHANAWGLCHAGVAAGSTMIMPGPHMIPKVLADLVEHERVTMLAGVPTIFMGMLPELKGRNLSSLRVLPCGGSAVPKALSAAYRKTIGLPILHAWGMTETSPIATMCTLPQSARDLPDDVQDDLRTSQGIPVHGVQIRIADVKTGAELPWDGKTSGELQCRGPWVASGYYNRPDAADSFTTDGWLRTGDVAVVESTGFIRIVDRTKDLIKSGGEWISSVELENEIMAHPKVKEAAVIGVPSKKWAERPLACVVLHPNQTLTLSELRNFLEQKLTKWSLPDDIHIMDVIPKTSVGKYSKLELRKQLEHITLP